MQRRQHDQDVFENACISIWVEDWTPVGEVVLALRQAGRDIAADFAARPDFYRGLHRRLQILDVNLATVALLGASGKKALIGTLADIVPNSAITFERWVAAFARGDEVYRGENTVVRLDGTARDCLVSVALPERIEDFRRLFVYLVDISEYKADQARLAATRSELARASRVSVMGMLAASIAHEVSNPLAAIMTRAGASLRWLRRPVPDLAEAEAAVLSIVDDAVRANAVVERTLAFIGNARGRRERLDMAETIATSVRIVECELQKHGARVRLAIASRPLTVDADPIQLQQVLVNLMLNAAQAMDEIAGPREITISARRDGGEIRLDVADTGPGIPPEVLPRLFDPFFSNREDGIGMGLAICRTCLEANGGTIRVSGEPGGGAIFHVTLPGVEE